MSKVNLLNNFIYAKFHHQFYKRFKRIHCPSRFIAEQLSAHGYKAKTYVISNGCDRAFAPPEKAPENEKFEIIMVGRLAPEKKQKILVSAIAQSKYKDKIHLTLLGNGPCKKKLLKQVKKLQVDADFGFLPKEELVKKLQQSDLYVHSSTIEIEAIACLEAIACGLVPIISDSKLSATPQFALDGRSLFKNDDAEDLAAKIDYWYENKDERLKMSKEYAESAAKYSLENSLAKTEEMFNDEINDKA